MSKTPSEERWPGYMKKKNTRKWCRGQKGIEHEWVLDYADATKARFENGIFKEGYKPCRPWPWGNRDWKDRWVCYHVDRCQRCGKVLRRDWEKCPDKLTEAQ